MRRIVVTLCWLCFVVATAVAGEVGFIEDFALAKDRETALKQLIPGTEDYYYYHCLHLLNTGQYEKAAELSATWQRRLGRTPRLTEIQTRHALLSYEKNPQYSLEFFRSRLMLRFDHQRDVGGAPPNVASTLDPTLISRERLLAEAWKKGLHLNHFEDSALDWLATTKLDAGRRRELLKRLTQPDVPNLPQLVLADMQSSPTLVFGSHNIHKQMTLAQLEELLRLQPHVLNLTAFVQVFISKLHPSADEDWRRDPALAAAYLDRLLAFVRRLSPTHNSLKANVLFHKLALDRSQGKYDRNLFLEYLALPRQQGYMAKRLLESTEARRFSAELTANFQDLTLLAPIVADEALVRDYLKHFLADAESTREFEPFINDIYLRRLFAETKLELGRGEPEQWASHLPPEEFRRLKERIDIDFAPTNKPYFTTDEQVTLDLQVKNVPTLLVKVFEINTRHYYQTYQREVDTDINLDGLVANHEEKHTFTEPSLRRVAKRFAFPQLNKPGVYVIDFIGGGKNSRALIRKGKLTPLVSTSIAGQTVTVIDDARRPVKDATLWLGGQEFPPNKDGTILIPFSTRPGQRPMVLSQGDFSCLDYLAHQEERYQLEAGMYIDRESLLPGRIASVLVRPGLFLNGERISVKLLEEVRLQITATDQDGIATAMDIPNFKLADDQESIYDFRVPERLAHVSVTLHAKVKSLTHNKQLELKASQGYSVNGIDKTNKIEDLHLAKFGNDYVLELRGRTGEARPDRPVRFTFKHRDFYDGVQTVLKSNGEGRIILGPLSDIERINVTGPDGIEHHWQLPLDKHTYQAAFHARAGEVITLPYLGSAQAPSREEFALWELRGAAVGVEKVTPVVDRFPALSVREGVLEIQGLPPGDYDLWLKKEKEAVRIKVVDGQVYAGFVLGKARVLQLSPLKPVSISGVDTDAETVTVRLRDASSLTRVHVFATRYQPAFSAYRDLATNQGALPRWLYPGSAESAYLMGRKLDEEYRYILDRRQQKKFPGNMLERPSLLLNPWARGVAPTGEQTASTGEDFGRGGGKGSGFGGGYGDGGATGRMAALDSNLDFLADASAVLANLAPDKNGMVKINRKLLGPHSMIHIVAVDLFHTTSRMISLPEQPAKFVDLRLRRGLDPSGHFSQQKQVNILQTGQTLTVEDVSRSRFEAYDSLPRVYALYATLSGDPKLAEFAFLMTWPTLKPEEKQTLYAKYACHELHFFLAKKDPAFFRDVVRPYLANKKDKTFLDHWLLEADLKDYLQPWQYARLNTVERILLAQRIPGEQAKTARHLQDLQNLLPPNPDRTRTLFETAVKGGDLDKDDKSKARLRTVTKGVEVYDGNGPRDIPKLDEKMPARPGAGLGGGARSGGDEVGGQIPPVELPAQKRMDGQGDKGAGGPGHGGGANINGQPARPNLLGRAGINDELRKQYAQERRAGLADRGFQEMSGSVTMGVAIDRGEARKLYRKVEPTQEWAENNYYRLPIGQQIENLVTVNAFWVDYAKHDPAKPFFSPHLAEPSRNFTEIMFALAVLDLPFTPGKHALAFDGGKMTFTPGSAVVAFHEQVRPIAAPSGNMPILVSQNFYRPDDRFRIEAGERQDKFLTGEFIAHLVYGCQVVVTNPTSARQKLSVLLQIPHGSLPLAGSPPTRTVLLDLEPYRTQTFDYQFYFPMPGKFPHFPVHVAKNEALVALVAPFIFNTLLQPTKPDTESWAYVSQNGTNEEVLAFLQRENPHLLDLEKIAFRLKDKDFYTAVLRLLQDRHVYNSVFWSYSILHQDVAAARQFLLHDQQVLQVCGGPINSPLLTLDPVVTHQYEHLEYKPLVNARAHSLGKRRQIVNGRLNEQYHRYLQLLSYRATLTDEDWLAVTYYLLLQDRIEEALAAFAKVHPEKVATKMQYDYCAAYLEMFSDEPQRARAIAEQYMKHPVDRWRKVFAAIVDQLDEIDGKGTKLTDAENRSQQQTQLAANEPAFDFTIDAQKLNLTWKNVEAVRVNYYLMDVELLFSRNPFVQQSGDQFATIRPNTTQEVKLPAGQTKLALELPANLRQQNVFVEITAAGKNRGLPYYANAMNVQMNENYGQVRVTDAATGKALPKAYVKTYVRFTDGRVKFYKDGYTDHRGRFDYASISTQEGVAIERLAVLVMSEERGVQIREVSPPQQ